jgi:outer membrane protein assembly factor BamB
MHHRVLTFASVNVNLYIKYINNNINNRMNSTPENEYWLICPVCYKPNPVGSAFCKYCWGTAIRSQKPVTTGEMEKILERHRSYVWRRRLFTGIAIGLASCLVLAVIVLAVLYSFSDRLSRPLETLSSGSSAGEWAMFRRDLSNSGVAGSSSVSPQGTVKWVFATGGAIHSSPAVADGTIYFGSRDGKLYALDAATGAERWEYQTGSWVESTPAVVGGVVYFGSNDGALYALDAATGERLWAFETTYPIMSSPAVAGGVVYFGADDYSVYAVDASRGTRIWRFRTSGTVKSSPAVDNGILYIGSDSGYAYALNARTGRVRLDFKTFDSVPASPVVMDKTVFFASFRGYLYALDGNARSWPWENAIRPMWLQLWAFDLAPKPPDKSGFLWGMSLGDKVTSSPVLAEDSLYIGSGNDLLAVDLKSQQKQWSFKTQGPVSSSPAVTGNAVYVGSEDGRLYAIDMATGTELWDFPTGGEITSSPAVADGTVYIGSHDGKLYAIK